MRIAVFCVGSDLMLDDGLGPAVYRILTEGYDVPEYVDLFDVGTLSMDMINRVDEYDSIITVDAVDGSGCAPGTVLRYSPDDVARRDAPMQSLHELKLSDLFDAALLLGYRARGTCLGMQVENMDPANLTVGLTPKVREALPALVDALLAELVAAGCEIRVKSTGQLVAPGYGHPAEGFR